jgi:hypothetical protein
VGFAVSNEVAGPGEVFVCMNCGRRSFDLLGWHRVHSGWSITCVINAVKYREMDLVLGRKGEVARVRAGAEVRSVLN